MKKNKILIVDDELEMLESFRKLFLKKKEYQLTLIDKFDDAVKALEEKDFDLLLADLRIGKNDGIELCRKARDLQSQIKVFIISGYGTIESSVEAIKSGAVDFIEKPFTASTLFNKINRVLNISVEKNGAPDEPNNFYGLLYRSEAMSQLVETIKSVAATDLTILIQGESGTGKELVARALHRLSKRNNKPFVPVNCGALPETLFESELFGHEKGAFTGALARKPGLLEFADQGTFFLDEITETPVSIQVKLLRMIEERKIRRLGGQIEHELDIRIISATNQNLEEAVIKNRLREDLFYRLSSFTINIPPLRERRDDILPIFYLYLGKVCRKHGTALKNLSQNAEDILRSYNWPGNVREIINVVNKLFYICQKQNIYEEDLPLPNVSSNNLIFKEIRDLPYRNAKDKLLEAFEIDYIKHNISKYNGNISLTADKCGMDRRTIHRLIQKFGIIFKD